MCSISEWFVILAMNNEQKWYLSKKDLEKFQQFQHPQSIIVKNCAINTTLSVFSIFHYLSNFLLKTFGE